MRSFAMQLAVFLTVALPLSLAADPQGSDAKNPAPVVHTKLGGLRGEYVRVKGTERSVHAYLGVPFAKPPVSPGLRLAPPQPVEAWDGVREATTQPPMCIQNKQVVGDLENAFGLKMNLPDISEDCLYLNIYTPANRAPDAKLPVMVWIHGGGFTLGSASAYDGSSLSAYEDVVVALIQYRLGVLGFLSTADEHMPGNFGLLDQVQALRWVQEHIHNFGGDPNSVTIFGESAGGVSVSLLLLSPLSDGLFHRAIAESGTAGMASLVTNAPLPVTKMVANASGCSFESTEKFTQCMKNLDLDSFVTLTEDLNLVLPVTVDGHFLEKPVKELYRDHKLLKLPFMTGVNNDEGGWLLAQIFASPNWTEGMDREPIDNMLKLFNKDDSFYSDLIAEGYIGSGEDRVKNRNGYTELIGDLLFVIPAITSANAHRDAGAPVYFYLYQHAPTFLQAKRPSFVGCDHGDEIFTVLGFCFTTTHVMLNGTCQGEEEEFTKTMMRYWANFARTGSPNEDGLAHWPKYGVEEEYLDISLKEQVTRHHLKKDRFIFMTQTVPEKTRQQKEKADRSEL